MNHILPPNAHTAYNTLMELIKVPITMSMEHVFPCIHAYMCTNAFEIG